MKVIIKKIPDTAAEQVIIECVKQTKDIDDIKNYVLSKDTALTGTMGERSYRFNLEAVFYFEAVGERVFAYTDQNVFEIKRRLYEVENTYQPYHFIRCSKSVLINLMKVESLSPALNGRFTAHLKNKEKVIISRQYVGGLKAAVLGGE